ncbi:MAG TPA: extracellular solute-binding protein [Candidatus Paceibacterota bacterium]|nr:extracellular solute-binding protein [Candidatus Paceibacterota bacterium]
MKVSLFQGIIFGIFGIGALIGLFVFSTYTTRNNSSGVGTVVIWGTLSAADVQEILTTVTQTDTTFKNVSYVQKDPATIAGDLATAIATGAAPDLVLASQEDLLTLSRFLSPIPSATLSASTFSNTFLGEGSVFAVQGGAGYYGIPFLVDPLVLFSNHSILSSDGIAVPPTTWEALTGLVPTVAILTPSQQITRGLIALGTYDNVHDARGILSSLFLQTGVPLSQYSSGGNLTANLGSATSNGVPLGHAVLGFYTQFADPSKVSYTWNASLPDSQQMFLAGNLALYIGYASEARYLQAANPNLNFSVTPLPQPATATAKNVYGLVYAFMLPRGARNPAGAYQAAATLTGPAAQAAAATATGLAPATLDQLATVPADPIAAVAYAEALYASGWLSPAPSDTDSVFSSMIGDVISGRSSLDTALASAEQSLTALLQQ